MRKVVAVDFDGTIVTEAFPNIGEIKHETVLLMKVLREKGHNIVIWTARSGKFLEEAEEFLILNGIPYDYINENPEDEFYKRGEQGRKIFAHIYLDDRAYNIEDISKVRELI